jgi:release factor glutamine methyltransferase
MGLQIKEILNVAENILSNAGDEDAKKDAEILLCYVLRYDQQKLFMNWAKEVDDIHSESFLDAVQRRAEGEPTQYITNIAPFMDNDFFVDERVLIPRDDTEVLVREVIEYLKSSSKAKTVLDLCTGSGIIAVSLAKRRSGLKITASDVSRDAVGVANTNAQKLGAGNHIKFVTGDLFAGIKTGIGGQKFDVIVSNPPYIRRDVLKTLQREIREHEPMLALDGGEDGLDFYRRIIADAPAYMKKGGALFLEIGHDQAEQVSALIDESNAFGDVTVVKDIAELDRVVRARL